MLEERICFSEAHPGVSPQTPQCGLEQANTRELTFVQT